MGRCARRDYIISRRIPRQLRLLQPFEEKKGKLIQVAGSRPVGIDNTRRRMGNGNERSTFYNT